MTEQTTAFFDAVYSGDYDSPVIDCICNCTHFANSEQAGDWELGTRRSRETTREGEEQPQMSQ